MAKRDFYQEPEAPRANDLTPVLQLAALDDRGAVLLVRRADDGRWALPGGFMEPGERFAEAAVREFTEETGLTAEATGVVGLYSDPSHVTSFDDGTVHQQCSVVLSGRVVGGAPSATGETSELGWFGVEELDALSLHPVVRLRVEHALRRSSAAYLG